MYVRQISKTLADGRRVRYLQLAHKYRDPETGRPKDKVLYHFGPEHRVDREQIRRLIRSLSRFLGEEERIEVEAQLATQFEDLHVKRSVGFGGTFVLDALWRHLELPSVLAELLSRRGFEADVERLLFAMAANRALAPRSKLALERWVGRKVHVEGLEAVRAHQLYRAMDFLVDHDEAIQEAVFFSVASLLNLEVDVIFFDTTSTYFEIEEEDEDPEDGEGLRRYGHSKDHRPDLPQVVIGLAVTRDGIPVRCWVWPGKTADAKTVEQVQEDLAGWRLSRVLWVVDRGFDGRAQRRAFQRGGGHVIVGEKLRLGDGEVHEALKRPGRYRTVRENLQIKEVVVDGVRHVVVLNPQQAERDRRARQRRLEKLEAELESLNRKRRGAKAHSRRVCALMSHPVYRRYLREQKNGRLVIDRGRVRAEAKLDGKYLIACTDPSLDAEDVALGYKQLQDVEAAFRTLKHTLELRPVYHRLEERIRAHVLLCWLALLLIRVVERDTGLSWYRVREELEDLNLVELFGPSGRVEMLTDLTPPQRNILNTLEIKPPARFRTIAPKGENG